MFMRYWLEMDAAWTAKAGHWVQAKPARGLAAVVAHSGDSPLWLFGGVLLWRFGFDIIANAGERIVLITALTWVLSTVLKYFVQRPRPAAVGGLFYLKLDAHSFPSGHATRVGGLWIVLWGLLPLSGAVALGLWGLSVCLSRVALGLHYVGDVLGGLLVGMLSGGLLLWLIF